ALGAWRLPKDLPRRQGCPAWEEFFALTQFVAPRLYAPVPETLDWDSWQSSGYEYERFSSSSYDLALTGPYQFVARDAYLSFLPDADAAEQRAQIDAFLDERPAHEDNGMTGLL